MEMVRVQILNGKAPMIDQVTGNLHCQRITGWQNSLSNLQRTGTRWWKPGSVLMGGVIQIIISPPSILSGPKAMVKLPQRSVGLVGLLSRMLLTNVSLWTIHMKGDYFETFESFLFCFKEFHQWRLRPEKALLLHAAKSEDTRTEDLS